MSGKLLVLDKSMCHELFLVCALFFFFSLHTLCWKKCKKSVPRSCKQRWPLCIMQHTAKTGTNTYQSCLLNSWTVIILCESLTRNCGRWELFYNYYIIIHIPHLAGSSQETSVARDVFFMYYVYGLLRLWPRLWCEPTCKIIQNVAFAAPVLLFLSIEEDPLPRAVCGPEAIHFFPLHTSYYKKSKKSVPMPTVVFRSHTFWKNWGVCLKGSI